MGGLVERVLMFLCMNDDQRKKIGIMIGNLHSHKYDKIDLNTRSLAAPYVKYVN
jgi:hypothetical protein